jgi:hypothetical protein
MSPPPPVDAVVFSVIVDRLPYRNEMFRIAVTSAARGGALTGTRVTRRVFRPTRPGLAASTFIAPAPIRH